MGKGLPALTRGIIEATMAVFEKNRAACTPVPAQPVPAPLPPAPHIFIGHGRADDWRDLKDHLHEQHHYPVEAYETGARAGHAMRDVLDAMMESATFAILVLTAEDEMADGQLRPGENVVHETGFFQGHLGWTRAVIPVENGVEPFSNVAGITQIRYDKGEIRSTFGDVVATVKAEFGPGPSCHDRSPQGACRMRSGSLKPASQPRLPPTSRRIMGSGQRSHGVDAGSGVSLEGTKRCVPGLGHQQRQGHPLLGEVGDGRVAQLGQGTSGGCGREDFRCSAVGEPSPACGGITVRSRWCPRPATGAYALFRRCRRRR
jgi:hypothetical protein